MAFCAAGAVQHKRYYSSKFHVSFCISRCTHFCQYGFHDMAGIAQASQALLKLTSIQDTRIHVMEVLEMCSLMHKRGMLSQFVNVDQLTCAARMARAQELVMGFTIIEVYMWGPKVYILGPNRAHVESIHFRASKAQSSLNACGVFGRSPSHSSWCLECNSCRSPFEFMYKT